jgi:hypothetical protein
LKKARKDGAAMLLRKGEKIHVIERRRFDTDLRRHLIGEIAEVAESGVRVAGYTFVFDPGRNEYLRKPEFRTRIISLFDAANIINVLPENSKIEKAVYTVSKENQLVVTDRETFSLDINEFGTRR